MNKKYELTDETIHHDGIILHRIEAIEDFDDVRIGDKGGWVESTRNLSQKGNAFLYGNSKVYGDAQVSGDAKVRGYAEVYDNALVYGNAEVYGNAKVYDNAEVYDKTRVSGNAVVCDDAEVFAMSVVAGDAVISGNACVCGNATVDGNAKVYGDAYICGEAVISGDANVENIEDYMTFKNGWSSGRHFTWTRSNNMWKVGCFYGTGEELIKKAYRDSTKKGDCYKAVVDFVENIVKLIENESK